MRFIFSAPVFFSIAFILCASSLPFCSTVALPSWLPKKTLHPSLRSASGILPQFFIHLSS
jgi:hypothetical protein